MKMILNERKYAETLLNGENHCKSGDYQYSLKVLAKYFKSQGCNKKQMTEKLSDFLKEQNPVYQEKFGKNGFPQL